MSAPLAIVILEVLEGDDLAKIREEGGKGLVNFIQSFLFLHLFNLNSNYPSKYCSLQASIIKRCGGPRIMRGMNK